mmetsp:Transcript_26369/g.40251  ORF Transcript_26369/g.40251 Transcript_26369/m.40251 type:complete len:102 (-) Transcript_26369:5217-5522(-)
MKDEEIKLKDLEIDRLKKRLDEIQQPVLTEDITAKDELAANYSSIEDGKPYNSKNPESIEAKLREEINKKNLLKDKIKEQKNSLIQLNKYIATIEEKCSAF